MYCFLSNLSFLDIMVATSIAPKMMRDFLSQQKTISVSGCIAQCYFYFFFISTEFILLAVMSVDCYMAMCTPLHYSTITSPRMSVQLVVVSWVGGFFSVLSPIIIISQLPFFGPHITDHFFCDTEPLIKLSCADTSLLEFIEFSLSSMVLLSLLMLTVVSYLYIIATILSIPSTTGWKKTSTSTSHITVTSVFYGSAIFMYVVPNKGFSFGLKKMVTLQTAIVTHLLNPFIYTLRNQMVKEVPRDTVSYFLSGEKSFRMNGN
ncbi:olfactory receptor 6M1-like [Gopherus evgoodei]|uniref:olfactory receptor 6M1-like n=1 Tax=Gopherus evgoodei TaxID=1825980 RepID=UPI0011CEF241|nr:olfactory receptor 6M1-like [Gopherus evgoodei]